MYGHKFVSQRSAVDANGEVIVLVDGTVLADSPDTQPTELRIRSKVGLSSTCSHIKFSL